MRARVKQTTDFLLLVASFFFSVALVALSQSNSPAPAVPSNGEEIIPFLNQTIVWYRQITLQQQLATEPSDVLFLNDNRQIADQIVRLSFDFARARAQSLSTQPAESAAGHGGSESSQYQRLADAAAKADQQVKSTQQEIDAQRQQLATATGKKRRTLEALMAETQSELDLFQARRDVLR